MRRKNTDILKIIVENLAEPLSIRQIAQNARMDYKNVHTIVQRLEKEGIVMIEKISNINRCVLVKKPHPLIYETEYARRELILKNLDLKVLWRKFDELKFPFITLLFGSQVKGKSTKHSDIDLLIIAEKSRERKIDEIVSIIPLPLHPTVVTYEDFIEMLKSREFTVVSEAIKKNVILHGIEDYYRLLSYAE